MKQNLPKTLGAAQSVLMHEVAELEESDESELSDTEEDSEGKGESKETLKEIKITQQNKKSGKPNKKLHSNHRPANTTEMELKVEELAESLKRLSLLVVNGQNSIAPRVGFF